MKYPTKYFSRWLYFRRCKQSEFLAEERILIWRDLSIEWSTNINPYAAIPQRQKLPLNLVENYYPGKKKKITIKNKYIEKDLYLDITEANGDKNLNDGQSLPNAFALLDNNKATVLRDGFLYYLQRGNVFLREGEVDFALRSFLNALRIVGGKSEDLYRNIATCLVELGDFEKAALKYVEAGEYFLNIGSEYEAADVFERAGLAWEALKDEKRPPGFTIGSPHGTQRYDSTMCFQVAKRLFSSAGDYDAVSRCFVLERDAHCRWTPSKNRQIQISIMRWIWLYGESPVFSLRSILFAWLLFAFGFLFCGFRSGEEMLNYDLALRFETDFLHDLLTSLYFSAVTMTTLGYGDCSPELSASRLLSGLEAFLGILFAAMFLVSIQRRYVGR